MYPYNKKKLGIKNVKISYYNFFFFLVNFLNSIFLKFPLA